MPPEVADIRKARDFFRGHQGRGFFDALRSLQGGRRETLVFTVGVDGVKSDFFPRRPVSFKVPPSGFVSCCVHCWHSGPGRAWQCCHCEEQRESVLLPKIAG
jgi:hypothetical protein